jgi:hypothetical protein
VQEVPLLLFVYKDLSLRKGFVIRSNLKLKFIYFKMKRLAALAVAASLAAPVYAQPYEQSINNKFRNSPCLRAASLSRETNSLYNFTKKVLDAKGTIQDVLWSKASREQKYAQLMEVREKYGECIADYAMFNPIDTGQYGKRGRARPPLVGSYANQVEIMLGEMEWFNGAYRSEAAARNAPFINQYNVERIVNAIPKGDVDVTITPYRRGSENRFRIRGNMWPEFLEGGEMYIEGDYPFRIWNNTRVSYHLDNSKGPAFVRVDVVDKNDMTRISSLRREYIDLYLAYVHNAKNKTENINVIIGAFARAGEKIPGVRYRSKYHIPGWFRSTCLQAPKMGVSVCGYTVRRIDSLGIHDLELFESDYRSVSLGKQRRRTIVHSQFGRPPVFSAFEYEKSSSAVDGIVLISEGIGK